MKTKPFTKIESIRYAIDVHFQNISERLIIQIVEEEAIWPRSPDKRAELLKIYIGTYSSSLLK